MRPGPITWRQLAEMDLSGSTITANAYGIAFLILEELGRIEPVEESEVRFRLYRVDGEYLKEIPMRPFTGPLIDEKMPEALLFAVGSVGEGMIILPCPLEEFLERNKARSPTTG